MNDHSHIIDLHGSATLAQYLYFWSLLWCIQWSIGSNIKDVFLQKIVEILKDVVNYTIDHEFRNSTCKKKRTRSQEIQEKV